MALFRWLVVAVTLSCSACVWEGGDCSTGPAPSAPVLAPLSWCQDGLSCVEGVCVAPAEPPEPVELGAECGPGRACPEDTFCHSVSKVCAVAAAVDAPCSHDHECVPELICNTAKHGGVCRAPGPDGDDCHKDRHCAGTLACHAQIHDPGVCRPPGGAGQPCERPSHCIEGLLCNRQLGQCSAPLAHGGACGSDADCVSPLTCYLKRCEGALPW